MSDPQGEFEELRQKLLERDKKIAEDAEAANSDEARWTPPSS
jgi:hypothetical protein